jgi:hypothetical protein
LCGVGLTIPPAVATPVRRADTTVLMPSTVERQSCLVPRLPLALPGAGVASDPLMDHQGVGLAIEKVVHHDDVVRLIIMRSRGDIAGGDPDGGDTRIVKHDAEEG